jgi:hypothetical protein
MGPLPGQLATVRPRALFGKCRRRSGAIWTNELGMPLARFDADHLRWRRRTFKADDNEWARLGLDEPFHDLALGP